MAYRDYNNKSTSKFDNPIITLLIIQVAVFAVLFIFDIILQGASAQDSNAIFKNVALQGPLKNIFFKPWTLITFGFSHISIYQLIGNLIWLWLFGHILFDSYKGNHILPTFIYGILLAGVFFIVMQIIPWPNRLNITQTLIGANVGVMALAVFTVFAVPHYKFMFLSGSGVPIWVMGMIFFLLQAVNVINYGVTAMLSYVFAAFVGYRYFVLIQKGYEPDAWMHNIYNWFKNLLSKTEKDKKGKVFYIAQNGKPAIVKKPNLTQKRVDELLDKISEKGLDALTDEEKEFLKKASKN